MARSDRSHELTGASPAFLEGFQLGVKLLHDLETSDNGGLSPYCLDAQDRAPGRPQENLILAIMRATQENTEKQAGLSALLTDYISSCCDGAIPDAAFYERYLPVTQAN